MKLKMYQTLMMQFAQTINNSVTVVRVQSLAVLQSHGLCIVIRITFVMIIPSEVRLHNPVCHAHVLIFHITHYAHAHADPTGATESPPSRRHPRLWLPGLTLQGPVSSG